jgi:hypothetical protein
MILSWILDMLWLLACVGTVQKFAQTKGIFLYDLSCIIEKSA